MAHDVFISHAHKDKRIVDAICKKLESAQIRCWTAGRNISAGEDWTEATRKAIGSCPLMILVLSENANASPHIEREIAHAFYTGRQIIPVRLTNTLPKRDFLFYLGNVRCFDALGLPAEEHLDALAVNINGLVRGQTIAPEAIASPGVVRAKTGLNFSDSWLGALEASHYRTLTILKRGAIVASIFAVPLLFWFVYQQTNPGTEDFRATDSGPRRLPDPSNRAPGDASIPKPTYTFTRFGLWAAADNSSTRSPLPGPQEPLASAAVAQPPSGTPDRPANIDQQSDDEAESLRTEDVEGAKSREGIFPRVTDRHQLHRRKSRSKDHHAHVRSSEGSLVGRFKGRIKRAWHRIVERNQ
jgi:TIR domain